MIEINIKNLCTILTELPLYQRKHKILCVRVRIITYLPQSLIDFENAFEFIKPVLLKIGQAILQIVKFADQMIMTFKQYAPGIQKVAST